MVHVKTFFQKEVEVEKVEEAMYMWGQMFKKNW